MRKHIIDNPRYPHVVKVMRMSQVDWLSDDDKQSGEVIYFGKGKCQTSGGTEGRAVDMMTRQISIPVRFDEWGELVPSSGDIVTVGMGSIVETMELKDFEPDNNRTVLYCQRNANADL